MRMRFENDKKIVTITFYDFYTPVRTELYNKKNKTTYVKNEPLLNLAMSSTGLKHQLELKGFKEVKENRYGI